MSLDNGATQSPNYVALTAFNDTWVVTVLTPFRLLLGMLSPLQPKSSFAVCKHVCCHQYGFDKMASLACIDDTESVATGTICHA